VKLDVFLDDGGVLHEVVAFGWGFVGYKSKIHVPDRFGRRASLQVKGVPLAGLFELASSTGTQSDVHLSTFLLIDLYLQEILALG
jgi:hypothetical protein